MEGAGKKFLFVLNNGSGTRSKDWESAITEHFNKLHHTAEFYVLPEKIELSTVRSAIDAHDPHYVVAVGGDGTVTLVAECLLNSHRIIGILPAGSANGMAKEMGISVDETEALATLTDGVIKKISAIRINDRLSIHLSDIGLNAYMIKEFETIGKRGFLGYLIASAKVLWKNPGVRVEMKYNNKSVKITADIILIANATSFGTGVIVNPLGKLDDDVFEVIVIEKLQIAKLIKTTLQKSAIDRSICKIYQASEVNITSAKPVHFQVDGEYIGKVRELRAELLQDSLRVVVPS